MTFKEALKVLNIENYENRIFYSNSHGELFHLMDYIMIAETISEKRKEKFREWFEEVVRIAEECWDRPESVFQHIVKILNDCEEVANKQI